MDVGIRLKKYRERSRMSQKELAQLINIDNTLLSHWERGKNKINVDKIPAICEILNISPNDLFDFNEEASLKAEEKRLVEIYRELGESEEEIILRIADALLCYKRIKEIKDEF